MGGERRVCQGVEDIIGRYRHLFIIVHTCDQRGENFHKLHHDLGFHWHGLPIFAALRVPKHGICGRDRLENDTDTFDTFLHMEEKIAPI